MPSSQEEAKTEIVDEMYSDFSCPITYERFDDPVVIEDGHTYERTAIVKWLGSHNNSPLTGKELLQKTMFPNYTLKKVMAEVDQHDQNLRAQLVEATLHGELHWVKYLAKHSSVKAMLIDSDIVVNAISSKNIELVQWLADQGVPLATYYFQNGTLLNIPCTTGHLDMLKFLVDKQHIAPTPKYYLNNRLTISPLMAAVSANQIDIVKWLVSSSNLQYLTEDTFLSTPLSTAIQNNFLDIVTILIERNPRIMIYINPLTKNTPLEEAIAYNQMNIIHYFFKFYFDERVQKTWGNHLLNLNGDGSDRDPPFVLAAAEGQLDILKFFIKAMNDKISLTTKKMAWFVANEIYFQQTADHVQSWILIMDYLKNIIPQEEKCMDSPFKITTDEFLEAIKRNEFAAVKYFFKNKLVDPLLIYQPFTINIATYAATTIPYKTNCFKIVYWLINQGVDINAIVPFYTEKAEDLMGYNPLLTAIKLSNVNLTHELLTLKADPTAKVGAGEYAGLTALELAQRMEHSGPLEKILEKFIEKNKSSFSLSPSKNYATRSSPIHICSYAPSSPKELTLINEQKMEHKYCRIL